MVDIIAEAYQDVLLRSNKLVPSEERICQWIESDELFGTTRFRINKEGIIIPFSNSEDISNILEYYNWHYINAETGVHKNLPFTVVW